ncbi:hydrogenase iron-sulfur subunit [bacterium]|nr:hydrogenase iron-sulfur subunit [bacterium]
MAENLLQKWEKELNNCIRCGYCYENCHLYKIFNWESDSPRGKLLLTYGILSGHIDPTQNIAEKIFECFSCKQCEKGCSAKVPVTDILDSMREYLIDQGYEVDGVNAVVDEELCSGCGLCVAVCKPEAATLKDTEGGKKLSDTDRIKCEGCGVCIPTCPTGARNLKEGYGLTEKELNQAVNNYFGKIRSSDDKPKVIVFCCNWSIMPGLRLSSPLEVDEENFKVIITMCSGRITSQMLLEAFREGAWGVMIAACPFGDCEHDGNYKMFRRVLLLQNLFKVMNINPDRLKVEWIKTNEVAKLEKAMDAFLDKVEEFGPVRKEADSRVGCCV